MTMHMSHAVIMRIWEFGESDLLVSFFSSDRGRQKGVAKAGRKSRKRFANCLNLFCLTKLEYEEGKKGDLHFLSSCKLVHGFPGLRRDFISMSLASYMVELTELLFPQNVADPGMFNLLVQSFHALEQGERHDVLRNVFEAGAVSLGGYEINLERCWRCGRIYTGKGRAVFHREKGCIACLNCTRESPMFPGIGPEAVTALRKMQSDPLQGMHGMVLSEESIQDIKQILRLHIQYRIGEGLKSTKYLE